MKKNFETKIDILTVLSIIIIVPLIKPAGLAYNNRILNYVLQSWKLLSLLLVVIVFIKNASYLLRLPVRCSILIRGLLGLLIFELIYIFNTIIRGIDFFDLLNNCITCLLLFVYIGIMGKTKNRKSLIKSIDYVFTFYLICQSVSMILERVHLFWLKAEDGTPTYFFGPDNYSAFIIIPMLGVLLFIGCEDKCRIRFRKKDVVLLSVLTVCYIWTGSVTAACSLLILCFTLFLISLNRITSRAYSISGLIILFIFALLLIMGINIQTLFFGLFEILGKGENGISLNSRTYIWGHALKIIKENFLFGIGVLSEYEISNFALYGASHAHNIILELMLRTGFLGLICYLFYMLYPFIRYRRSFLCTKNAILLISVFVYLILSFMDFYPLIQAPVFLISFGYICADDARNIFHKKIWDKDNKL